jgi:glycosyltransferase involved in cell wall biosynthesis
MKVAHVTLHPPRGEKHVRGSGVTSYSKNLVSNIPVEPSEQEIVCNIIDTPEVYEEEDAIIHRVFERKPNFVLSVHKELKKIQPDIVHVQQELSLFGGVLTAYLLQWLIMLWRDKTVITLHGVVDPAAIDKKFVRENNSHLPPWLVRLAFKVIYTPLMRRAKHIIVHEQYFKDIVTECYHIDGNKVSVIPHGVEQFSPDSQEHARQSLNLPQNADIALFMGYATGYKGMDLLIEGFAKYAKKNRRAYLVIGAGKHPKLHDDPEYLAEYERIQKKAARLIPKKQYQWRGFIEENDIAKYYSASDLSLYPYTTALASSGPMAFAIGYEKPFLVSDAFAKIFDRFPRLIFDRRPESLAKKLDHFFSHHDEYSNVSRQLKRQRSWENVGEQTLGVYRLALMQGEYSEAKERATTG